MCFAILLIGDCICMPGTSFSCATPVFCWCVHGDVYTFRTAVIGGKLCFKKLSHCMISPSPPIFSILDFNLCVCPLRFSKNVSSNILDVVWNSNSIGGRPDSIHKVTKSDPNIWLLLSKKLLNITSLSYEILVQVITRFFPQMDRMLYRFNFHSDSFLQFCND